MPSAGKSVVFVDIDGPLAPVRAYALGKQRGLDRLDPVAVAMLIKCVIAANAKIVVSSSWALWGLESVRARFEANGLPWSLVHDDWMTPRDLPDGANRDLEIKTWLTRHPEVNRWAVLEDGHLDVPGLIRCCTFNGMGFEQWRLLEHVLGLKPLLPAPKGPCWHHWLGTGGETYECVRCGLTALPGDQHCPWTLGPPWPT